MYGVHLGSVLHDHVCETIRAQLCEHPAHHGHRVGQNTSVTAKPSPTFMLSSRGKILAWTTGDDQDEGARGQLSSEIAERGLTRGVPFLP